MTAYTSMDFIMYPPRPEGSIHPDDLDQYPGWWGQRKFNDTRTLIFVDPDGNVHLRTRQRVEHRQYELSADMRASIQSLPLDRGVWHVFDGGLMHNKTRGLKDRIILWDVLVFGGNYMLGSNYRARRALLNQICFPNQAEDDTPFPYETETGNQLAFAITDHLWMAETFETDLRTAFGDLLELDEIEGLVLKDPGGRLAPGVSEANNTGWLIRCRKPHPNYKF